MKKKKSKEKHKEQDELKTTKEAEDACRSSPHFPSLHSLGKVLISSCGAKILHCHFLRSANTCSP